MRLRAFLLSLALCAFAALAAFVPWYKPDPASAAGTNSIETPDTGDGDDVGRDTSLELDQNGYPVVSYYDMTNGDLKVLHCNDVNCDGGDESIETVDDGGGDDVGRYTSLALDAAGNPVVAYFDVTNSALKIVHCDDANCAGDESTNIETPDAAGGSEGISLALDASGFPVVSYWDTASFDLNVLHCDDANCTGDESTNIASPDTGGDVGRNSSIVLDGSGFPVISYRDSSNSNLKVVHCGDADCASGNAITSPDTSGDNVGTSTSITLDSSGFPVVSYQDDTNVDLKLLHCGDADCTTGNSVVTVDGATDTVGAQSSIALDADGNPIISYLRQSFQDLKVAHCGDPDCSSGNVFKFPDVGNAVGFFSSLQLDSDGLAVISYYDLTNGDLKVVHCGDAFCGGEKPTSFIVDDTGDASDSSPGNGVCDDGSGTCTLRAAIEEAQARGSADTISFNQAFFPPNSPPTLEPGSAFSLSSNGDTIDATDAGVIIDGMGGAFDCFTVSGDNNTIVGIEQITDCGNAVLVTGSGNTIGGANQPESGVQCDNIIDEDDDGYINDGCPAVGTAPETGAECSLGDATNDDAADDMAGGTPIPGGVNDGCPARGQGMTLNANVSRGVELSGAGATGNEILGNYLGTNEDGTAAVANSGGVRMEAGASDNTIGGTSVEERNLISGNTIHGVNIVGLASSGNVVLGNYIGTDVTGTSAVANMDAGIHVVGPDNVIGGAASGAGNLISGNTNGGVEIELSSATGNVVEGNLIGINASGTTSIANTTGVRIASSASENTIGGSTAGARNIISGNTNDGIVLISGATLNAIEGNYIGTNPSGTAALGNGFDGLHVQSVSSNTIGPDNVLSGNSLAGIHLEAASGNAILGNYIGTNGDGTAAIANGTGVLIESGAADNTIGDTQGIDGNLISGNSLDGVLVNGATTSGNIIDGNLIGTDHTGAADLGNGGNGVAIANSASGTAIGLSAGNTIAYNTNEGVDVGTGSGHSVRGNSIHSNGDLGIDLGAAGVTENDADDLDSGDNGLQNFPDLTSAVTGSVTVEGTFDSTPSTTFALDFYASASCDASGNGEGETYLGAKVVTTDGSGDASFTFTSHQAVAPGTFITATATDPSGNTSEFSDCFTATSVPAGDLAGNAGMEGDCADGTDAQDCLLTDPHGIHVVEPGGGAGQGTAAGGSTILYFADTGTNKVKQISPPEPTGPTNAVAGGGSGTCGGSEDNALGDGCDPTDAILNAPRDVYVSPSGDIYIADTDNCLVRRISGGLIETVAGIAATAPDCGYNGDGMDAVDAQLNFPSGIVVDEDDNLYIADTENCLIRKVDSAGVISTVAGIAATAPDCGYTDDRGPATGSQLNRPRDVSILFPDDDLIIADTDNHRIRRVYRPGGGITTIGGTGNPGYSVGLATSAAINAPEALQGSNYFVIFADTQNDRIRRINVLNNTIETLVGDDGVVNQETLQQPAGVAVYSDNLVWTDPTRDVIETAELNADGEAGDLTPIAACSILPGTSSIDWMLPAALFGVVLFRRRLGLLFAQLRTSLAPAPA